MAYAHDVIRWTIGGDCYNQGEIWTTGFYTGDDAGDIGPDGLTEAAADEVAARWEAFFEHGQTSVSERYRTLYVKGALWHSDLALGTHVVGDPVFSTYSTPPVGAYTASSLPPQVALAASMKSGYRNGPAANGRMYLPGVSTPVGNSGSIGDTQRGEICAQFLTFINGVNTDLVPLDAGKVILAGQGRLLPLPASPDRNAYVTKVRVGNYYDTQRRRRNAFNEVYTELGVA